MIAGKRMVLAFLALATCFPADAQWQRTIFSGKGERTDVPPPHVLSYFIGNAFLRDDGDDFCGACTPEDKAGSGVKYSIQPVVKQVGILAGYRIVDILCYLGSRADPAPGEVKWKFILVQVGPDSYQEIFHLSTFYTTVSVAPSRIVRSGDETILASMDSDGGNGGGCWEAYWWFDQAGPHPLDFSRLRAAIKDRVPQNTRFLSTCASIDLAAQRVRGGVQSTDARCHACDWVGNFTARFRLAGPLAEPREITFRPTEMPTEN